MSEPATPVFIVGAPRSGTSILTWCLGQHPNILPLEETYWIAKFARSLEPAYALGASRGARSQLSAAKITKPEFFEFFGNAIDHLIHLYESRRGIGDEAKGFMLRRSSLDPKKRWVDGTPENSFYIPELVELFPKATFIHILRDVGSVVKSLMNFSRAGGRDFTEGAAYEKWTKSVQACMEAERILGGQGFLRIRYSDFVSFPEKVLRACLSMLDEAFCPACLEPVKTKINSSKVPADFNPMDPATDPHIREEAEGLSRELLESTCPP